MLFWFLNPLRISPEGIFFLAYMILKPCSNSSQNFRPQYPFKELFLCSKNNKLTTLFTNEQYLHLVG